ncbi:MAG TPA: hypothetical protein VI819_00145 [Patescibacteria group bacterium]|nr:hypothetical protein [Patescibacteria group bacterium]
MKREQKNTRTILETLAEQQFDGKITKFEIIVGKTRIGTDPVSDCGVHATTGIKVTYKDGSEELVVR